MKHFSFAVAIALVCTLIGSGCVRPHPRLTQSSDVELKEAAIVPAGVLALETGERVSLTRGTETVDAKDGTELLPGDTLKVTAGTATIVYPDAGASMLDQGTEITLLPDGSGEGSVFTQIELVVGGIWTRFDRLLGNDERFSVNGNGVVATVRGTAFGVQLEGDAADVQVVDHIVDVAPLDAQANPQLASHMVTLEAGQGMVMNANDMKVMDANAMKKMVKAMTQAQKKSRGYQFVEKALKKELLKRKATIKLKGKPVIPERFKSRVAPNLLNAMELMREDGFAAPTRTVSPDEVAPTSTPSATMDTRATFTIK